MGEGGETKHSEQPRQLANEAHLTAQVLALEAHHCWHSIGATATTVGEAASKGQCKDKVRHQSLQDGAEIV